MALKKNKTPNELILDYKLFDKMSKDITKHYKRIMSIRKEIARNKNVSVDLKFEFLESLDIILAHMKTAGKELDKSKKVLKEL